MSRGGFGTRAPTLPFNPGSFVHSLQESDYPKPYGWGRGVERKQDREKRAKALSTQSRGRKEIDNLALRLQECAPNRRCLSGACPECTGAAQDVLVRAGEKFVQQHADGRIYRLSIVPHDGFSNHGQLDFQAFGRACRRFKTRLQRTGVSWFLGGHDFSFNEDRDGKHPACWSHHFYGIAPAHNESDLRAALVAEFPNTDEVPIAVKVKEWDGDKRVLRYALKTDFKRRISFDGTRYDKSSNGRRKCKDTDKQPLKTSELIELLCHLDKTGISRRLFLLGAQFMNAKKNGPTITRRVVKPCSPGNRSQGDLFDVAPKEDPSNRRNR